MRNSSDRKILRGTVDQLNVSKRLAFEELEPIITGCQGCWQILENKLKTYVF